MAISTQKMSSSILASLIAFSFLLIAHSESKADSQIKVPNSIHGTFKGKLAFKKIVPSSSNPSADKCPINAEANDEALKVRNLKIFKKPNMGYSYIFPTGAILNKKSFYVSVYESINGKKTSKRIAIHPELPYRDGGTKVRMTSGSDTSCYWIYNAEIKYEDAARKLLPISVYRDYFCAPKKSLEIETYCFSDEFKGTLQRVE